MIRIDPEDLRPAFSTCILEVKLYVCERLIDLLIDFFEELAGLWVPAAW